MSGSRSFSSIRLSEEGGKIRRSLTNVSSTSMREMRCTKLNERVALGFLTDFDKTRKCDSIVPDRHVDGTNSKGGTEDMRSKTVAAGMEAMEHETAESEQIPHELEAGPNWEEIRQRAYEIHLERGGVHGRDQDDWLQAERDLAKKYHTS
jgi:hypothetical protein